MHRVLLTKHLYYCCVYICTQVIHSLILLLLLVEVEPFEHRCCVWEFILEYLG